MLAKCVVLWITTSAIVASETSTTERSRARDEEHTGFHGGRPVRRGEFPFLALLQVHTGDQEVLACSGSIPSPSTVLTAAHCDVGDIVAYAGMLTRMEAAVGHLHVQERAVESVAKPVFPLIYDIMICYITQNWEWTEFVAPVALSVSVKRLQPSFVVSCQVVGFGVSEYDREPVVAHVMDQLIGSSSQCLSLHPFLWFWSFWMCSVNINNKTMCVADSGGPAVCRTDGGSQQWAVNMGVGPKDTDCLPTRAANVYTATAAFRSWILDNIKDLPSSADGIQRSSVKISMYEVLQYLPLWLFLSTTVELLYLH